MVVAIVAAAGRGSRMGAGQTKVLLKLNGKTILERSLEAILGSSMIGEVVVTAPPEEIARFASIINSPRVRFVEGGPTRQISILNALKEIRRALKPLPGHVLIHDAARCLVSTALLDRAVEAGAASSAVTSALPVYDSLKRAGPDGVIAASLDRANLWLIQTPQVFAFELLERAHSEADGDGATDDAQLVEKIHPVKIVQGDKRNIKITAPEDLELARLILG